MRSLSPRGRSCVERPGETWRKPISTRASQKEKWLEGVLVFLTVCTVQICTVCNIYLFWKVCEFRVNVSFSGKLLYELTLDGFRMRWNYLYFVYLLSSVQIVFKEWFWHKHCRCFDSRSKGVEGAADLLEALSQSPLLEEADFHQCYEIPFAAWQRIPSGAWPKLRRSLGIPEEEVTRLCPKAGGGPMVGHNFKNNAINTSTAGNFWNIFRLLHR